MSRGLSRNGLPILLSFLPPVDGIVHLWGHLLSHPHHLSLYQEEHSPSPFLPLQIPESPESHPPHPPPPKSPCTPKLSQTISPAPTPIPNSTLLSPTYPSTNFSNPVEYVSIPVLHDLLKLPFLPEDCLILFSPLQCTDVIVCTNTENVTYFRKGTNVVAVGRESLLLNG